MDEEIEMSSGEIEMSDMPAVKAKRTKRAATGSKRSIEKPVKKAKAEKVKKPKAAKAKKPKAEKAAPTRTRFAVELSGERDPVRIDKALIKLLQKFANESELPSIGHAADRLITVGLARLVALGKYGEKRQQG